MGAEHRALVQRRDRLTAAGVPTDVAVLVASLPPAYAALEIVEIAKRDELDPVEVAKVHAIVADRLGLSRLLLENRRAATGRPVADDGPRLPA